MRAPAATLALLAVAACTSTSTPAKQTATPQVVIREDAPYKAAVQHSKPQATGHLVIQALAARCGITSITGTHAEYTPQRPLCQVRIRVSFNDADYHGFDPFAQRLVLSGGAELAPASDIMNIKRQPRALSLGGHSALELDLWFEPPTGAKATAVRVVGDHDVDQSVVPLGPASAVIPLTGLG